MSTYDIFGQKYERWSQSNVQNYQGTRYQGALRVSRYFNSSSLNF